MPRVQFERSAAGEGRFDLAVARRVAAENGATHIRSVYPMMGNATERQWRGRNQPRTLAFTVRDREHASAIQEALGIAIPCPGGFPSAYVRWRTRADFIAMHPDDARRVGLIGDGEA